MELNKTYYHLIAILTVGVWGSTFISTKYLLEHALSPQDIFFFRFLIAYVGIWFMAPRRLWADTWKDELWMAVGGISGGSVFFMLQNVALSITQASNASFIVCMAPLLTSLLFACYYKEERLSRRFVVGSLTALLGVGLVVFNGSVNLHLSPLGDFLIFLAACLWAVYSFFIRKFSPRYPILFLTRKVFFYGILTIWPAFLWLGPLTTDWALLSEPAIWGNLLFLGLVASLGAYAIWNVVMEKLGVIQSSNYLYLNPLFTMLGAILVLGEEITAVALLGAALIIFGVYWAEKRGH